MVVTVFDGVDVAIAARGWRAVASPSLRRLENARALDRLGIDGVSLGFVDAALRGTGEAPNYPMPRDLAGEIAPADAGLVAEVADQLAALVSGGGTVFVPIVGSFAHVDHRILRHAADRLRLAQVVYYEEFPYSSPAPLKGLAPEVESVDLDDWVAAAALYRSQCMALFGGRDGLANRLTAFAVAQAEGTELRYALRLWHASKVK